MEYLQKFKNYLLTLQPTPSKVTVKNYSLDVKHFISWFEAKYNMPFSPKDITADHILLFRSGKDSQLALRSLDRHVSSLRKFFHFLKLQGVIGTSPLEKIQSVRSNEDPYHFKEFKDFLYVYNASNLTIKNYIIDLKQFFKWLEESGSNQAAATQGATDILASLTNDTLATYRDELVAQNVFSYASINRKLSSLRKYITWASSQNLLENQSGFPINPNVIENIPSANNTTALNRAQNSMETGALAASVLTTASKPFQQISSSREIPEKHAQYSPFPPFRLVQKISKGINLAFDSVFIAPLSHATLLGHKMLWHLQGKPLFVAKPGALPVKFTKPAFVKNISKAFGNPEAISTKYFPWYRKIWHHARYTRPNWYKRYHNHAIAHYFNWAILMIVMSIIGFGFYNNFASRPQTGQHLLAAAQPNRILSFQGRLTDSSNNAITTGTNLRFAIYTDATSTGSALLWQEVDNVTPDANGVFSVLLGKNSTIQQSLFANNANLYLGITVEQTAELTPRQQLATVAYATNAETLQGLPPITQSGAGTSNVVLALNSAGNLSIGAASTFQTVGGAFTLSGDTLVLNTNAGTNGNITVAPDGQGFIDLQKPLVNTTQNNNIPSAAGSVEVDDTMAILATNSGVAALTINQNSTGTLFTASASGVSKFTIANSGAVTDTNYTTAGGIFYADGTGLLLQTASGSTGECLTSTGGGTPTWGTCGTGGGGSSFWTLANGTLYPVNTTLDVLFGGTSSSSANFAFINNTPGTGTPTASVSGNLTLNSAGFIQTTNNQQLTIGGTSTGNIVLKPLNGVGGTVTISGLATGVVHSTSGVLSSSAVNLATEVTGILPLANGGTSNSLTANNGGIVYSDSTKLQILAGTATAGQCLTSGSSSAPSWTNCAAAAGVNNYWTIANGALYPVNTTLDVLFGGTSSSSANFAFINNAAGIPTASISGNLTLNSNGVIQTTNNRLLTIGGTTTGAISFASNIASDLLPAATDTYNLGSAALEWNNLYVKNIISTGSTAGFWQRNLGVLAPLNTADDLAVGGGSTASAKFQIFGNTGNATTAGTLTFDGTGSLIQTTRNQGLTIGGDTTGNIVLKPLNGVGGTVTISGLATGVVHSTSGVLSASNVVLTSEVTGTLPIANGGTNTNTIGSAGRVAYSNGTNYAFTAVGSTGECLTSQGSGTPTWTSCSTAAGATNYWTLDNGLGILYPINTTLDVLFGGTSSNSANFAFINNSGTGVPTASISGNLTLNSNGVIATTNERPLVIGNTETGSVELSPKGTTGLFVNGTGNVGIGTTNTSSFQLQVAGNVGPNATDTFDLGSAALEWNNLYVKNIITSGSFSGFWQRYLGVLSPQNITDDLAIGGTATGTAKFQIFGNTGNATTAGTLTFTGSGSQIQTTSNQPLTLGGDTTGNIILKPNNGSGTVTINGSALDSAGSTFNAFTTNATTLNVGVTGGTTTVNSALTATGVFTANSTANLNGDVNLGNATADTITANGRFASSLIPKTDNTYDLGDAATPLRWRNLYLSGNYGGFWQRFNGVLSPLNITDDFAVGGTATGTAKFQIFGNTGNATTAGTLTFTGGGSQIQTTSNQTLTLGGNTTGTVAFGSNIGSDFIPQTTDLYNLGSVTNEWDTLYVKNIVTSGNTAGFWQRNLGALSPSNITDDLLAGGTATNSAKFAVLNMTGTGTPVASVSSGLSGTGMYFAANGTIQTVRNAGLTIGGDTTGNITLLPLNGGAGSTINLNAATIATNQTTVSLLNTTATTINFGGAATNLTIGAGSGTTINLNAATIDSNQATLALFATPTTVNFGTTSQTTNIKGNVTLGTNSSQTIAANGQFTTSLIPNTTSTYDLGSPTLAWRNLYLSSTAQYGGFWQRNLGALSPSNITDDLLAGGTSSNSAKFAVLNMTGTGTPVASVSSGLSGTALYISADGSIQTVRNETLTLGGTTTGNISFAKNVSSDILPYRSNVYSLGSSSLQWLNLYAQNIFQDGQPITQTWQRNLGVLAPLNISDDIAVGGTTTSSAKFQIFGNTGNATTTGTLTFAGTAATNLIAARNNTGLTIGDSQTGNIIFNGANVGIATTNPTEKLTVNGNVLASIYKDLENPSYYLDAANSGTSLLVAGNVGIATLTPQNKLDVNGAEAIGTYAGTNTAPLNGLIVSGFGGFGTTAVGNGALVVNQTNLSGLGDIFAASSSGTTKFMINNDGTVGIADNVTDATTLAKSALDVRKDSFGNALALFKQLSTDANADIITASNSAGQTEFRVLNTGVIQARSFQDLDSTAYFLDPAASGNSLIVAGTVGVGTTSPLTASGIDIEKDAKGNAALIVNQTNTTGVGDIFTASSSGVTKFTIQNDGTLIAKKYTTLNGVLYLSDTNGTVAQTAQGAAHTFLRGNGSLAPTFNAIDLATADVTGILPLNKGGTNSNLTADNGGIVYSDSTSLQILAHTPIVGQCLVSGGASAPSWSSCASASSNWWNVSNGALYPINTTLDFFIGGNSTTSAIFSVLRVDPGTGTPVASISSGLNGVSSYLSATGLLATTNMQPLSLGTFTTGAINIGTDATDRTITIGNTTGVNALVLTAGTGKINLNAAAIDDNQATATIFGTPTALTIGNSSGTTTFASNIDSSKATLALLATPTTVNEGSVSQTFNVLGNFTAGALSADLIPTGNGSINLGSPSHYYGTVYANTFLAPVTGGVSGFWQLTNNVISPVNAWNDLAVGGNATGSATPWQVFATTVGVDTAGTATTSGNLSFRGTTLGATTSLNLLNGNILAVKTSVGGDGGLGTVLTIANNGDITQTGNFTTSGNVGVNGGNITTSQTSANIFLTANSINIGTSGTGGGIGIGNSTSTSTFHGTIQLGDSGTNTVNVVAHVSSDLIPDSTNARSLGTASLEWKNLFLSGALMASNVYLPVTGGVGGYWTLSNSVLSPTNLWNDLAIGGSATSSAKFQVFADTGNATTTGSLVFAGTSTSNLIAARNNTGLTIGDSQTGNIFIMNGGSAKIGINTTTPGSYSSISTARLELADADGNNSDFAQRVAGGSFGVHYFLSSNGTLAVPTATTSNETLGELSLKGFGTTDYSTGALISAVAEGSFTNTGGLTSLRFLTSNGNSASERMRITPLGYVHIGDASSNGNAQLVVNQTNTSGLGDIFTASAAGTPKFTVANDGSIKNDLIPNLNDTYNLGSDPNLGGREWNNLYIRQIFTSSSGGVAGYWQLNNGALSPTNITNDVLTGGISTASATFRLVGASSNQGTLPVASMSAHTSFAGMVLDNTIGDLLTASSSGLSRFVINQSGFVGIGNGATNPNSYLDVSSIADTHDLLVNQDVPSTNLVTNPSFEGASTTNWTFTHAPEFAVSNPATESAMFGAYAVRMDTSQDSGTTYSFVAQGPCIAATPSTAYTISAYLYVKSGFSGSTGIEFQTFSDGACASSLGTSGRVNTTTTNKWTRLTSTITTDGSTNSIKIRWVASSTPTGIEYLDGVQVEKASSASPYIDGSLGPGYYWTGTPNSSTSFRRYGATFAYQTLNVADGIGAASRGVFPTLKLDQDGTGDVFTASVSGVSKFVITNLGSVGIGVTQPDVMEEVASSGASSELLGSPHNPAIRITNTSSAAFNEKAELQFAVGNSPITTAAITALYTDWTSPGSVNGSIGSDLAFSTKTSTGLLTERMRIDKNGNVGIGTTTQPQLLSLYSSQNPAINITGNNGVTTSSAEIMAVTSNGNAGEVQFRLANNPTAYGFRFVNTATGTVPVTIRGTAPTTSLLVDTTGNVGLGSTTPAQKLDVVGSIKASSFLDRDNTAYFIDPASSGTAGTFNGNVGIGTTSPGVNLDVRSSIGGTIRVSDTNGNGPVGSYVFGNGSTNNGFKMGFGNNFYWDGSNWVTKSDGGNNGGSMILGGYAPADMGFYTLASNGGASGQSIANASIGTELRMILKENGYVGIGTSAPNDGLDITTFNSGTGGQLRLVNNQGLILRNDGSNTYFLWAPSSAPYGVWDSQRPIIMPNDSDNVYFSMNGGSVGIGTTTPGTHVLAANDNNGSGKVVSFANFTTTNSTSVGVLELRLGATGTNSRFIQFYSGATTHSNGTGQGSVIFTTGGVAYNTLIADFGEYFDIADSEDFGDIVAAYSDGNKKAVNGTAPLIGVISDSAGFVGNAPQAPSEASGSATESPNHKVGANQKIVGLVGQIRTHLSTINGAIHAGDYITASNIPGYGQKATKAGPVIGRALADFDPANGKGETPIACPTGTPAGVYCARSLVYINVGHYDPDTQLADDSSFQLLVQQVNNQNQYSLQNQFGQIVDRVGGFSQLVAATFRAGLISAQEIATNSLAVSTTNITIAGQTLHDYIAGIVNEVVQNNQQSFNSPIASVDQLHTNLISPLASNSAIAIDLSGSQFTIRNNASGSAVATIDNTGNATFSGTLNSKNLAVNADATISGTLHAGKIVANDIEGLSAVVGTLSAQNITNVTNIYFATPSSTPTGGNFATGFGGSSSTNSGVLNASGSSTLTPYLGYANLASYSGFLAYVPDLSADTAMFNQGLVSLGATSLSDTTITGQLSIGSQLILADNSVNVLGATFEIQPLRQGGVSFEGGLLAIDTDGNLTVNGNAVFSKTLAANIISPISNDRNLTFQLGQNPTATGSALATSNLTVQNASGSGVFTIDQLGNLIASGEANIGKLNLQIAQPALAVSSTEMIATGSAGTAAVKAHQVEITIDNPLVTDKSLIYITPVGQSNVTPYLIRQVNKQSFTVGIPTQQLSNTTFNWLIVN